MALAAIALFWALSGCSQPTKSTPKQTIHIVNSLWQPIDPSTLTGAGSQDVARALARDVVDSDLIAAIASYNNLNTDDFLRLYTDTPPAIADAPTVNVFIVNPVTYAVNMEQDNIPRQELIDNAAGWKIDAAGQILFIDHVPPAPIITPPASNYAYYAIYDIDAQGHIQYEDHCGYRIDESFHQEDIGDYASADTYWTYRRQALNTEAQVNPGWTCKADHTLYTDPNPPN
jgi:hypothetical protein